jgi:hypothetical protein
MSELSDEEKALLATMKKGEEELDVKALSLLKDPNLFKRVETILDTEIVGEKNLKLTLFLLSLSKDLEHPQSIYTAGSPGSGKSYVTNKVLELFGTDVEALTRSSSKGLEYYFKDKNLWGKILLIQEEQSAASAQDSIRPLLSFDQKGLKIVTVSKEQKSQVLVVEGVPVYITTTAAPEFDTQMSSRVWILHPDESKEQTRKVLEFEANAADVKFKSHEDFETLKRAMILLSKLGPKKRVRIPFARKLAANFPATPRARRDFSKLLSIIKTHAYLYALQRKEEEHAIIATEEDLKQAIDAAFPFFKYTFTGITHSAGEILDVMKELRAQNLIATNKTIARQAKRGETWVKKNMRLLVDAGLVFEEMGKPSIFELSVTGDMEEVGFLNTILNGQPIDTIVANRLLDKRRGLAESQGLQGHLNPIVSSSRLHSSQGKLCERDDATIALKQGIGASLSTGVRLFDKRRLETIETIGSVATIRDDGDDSKNDEKRLFLEWIGAKGAKTTLDEIELAFAKGELAYFTGFEEWLDELIKLGDLSRPEPKTLSLKRA